MRYVERAMSQSIMDALNYFPVITITGPRQSGKSTMARHMFPDYRYLNLEEPDVREIAKFDPRSFLMADGGIILDEVQRCPELLSYIQGIVDSDRSRKFVLTGSAQFSLLKDVSQSLAGRTAIFELLPFSMKEVGANCDGKGVDGLLFEGMFPAVRILGTPPDTYYKNYVATYLERDLRDFSEVRELDTFARFLRLCAGRIGSLFVAGEISGELGVSVNTVNAWMHILQASYIVYMLEPFHVNTGKRLVKSRKLYFTDTGLASWLLRIQSPSSMEFDRMRGHLFENFVVMEALKKQFGRGKSDDMCFYRDSNGVEVDLMTSASDGYNCFEIKSSATYHPDFEKSLRLLRSAFPQYVNSANVVYGGSYVNTDRDPRILNLDCLDTVL